MNIQYLQTLIKSCYGTENSDYTIASSIASLLQQNKKCTQQEVISMAHVSLSSLIRFVYRFGFDNYKDFINYSKCNDLDAEDITYSYEKAIDVVFERERVILDLVNKQKDKICSLVELIKKAKKVVFIGYPLPQNVCSLQVKLSDYNIDSYAYLMVNYQKDILSKVNIDDVIIIFDYSQYSIRLEKLFTNINKNCHICAITVKNIKGIDNQIVIQQSSFSTLIADFNVLINLILMLL